jgi:hypothetical protein
MTSLPRSNVSAPFSAFNACLRGLFLATVALASLQLAVAQDKGTHGSVVYALTKQGQILQCFNYESTFTVLETDPTIRFLHAARETLYKIQSNGSIWGRSVYSSTWTYLGSDTTLASQRQFTGGDYMGGPPKPNDFGYNASLYKLSNRNIHKWDHVTRTWRYAATGGAISGRAVVNGSAVGNLRWVEAPSTPITSGVAGWIVHSGSTAGFVPACYTEWNGSYHTLKTTNDVVLDSYAPGDGWSVKLMALDVWMLYVEWRHSSNPNLSQIYLYYTSGNSTPRKMVEGYYTGMALADFDLYLLDNNVAAGRGVRRKVEGNNPAVMLYPPSGQVINQMVAAGWGPR